MCASYRVPMGDSPFGKRFILPQYKCEFDNPISVFLFLQLFRKSSSNKTHCVATMPPIWSCFPLAKGECESELKLGTPLFFGHMRIKMPQVTIQKGSQIFFFSFLYIIIIIIIFFSLVAPGRGVAQAPGLAGLTLGPALGISVSHVSLL